MGKAKRLTGKDISREQLVAAMGDGATFAELAKKLELRQVDDRALDGALQREKRKGVVAFGKDRRWRMAKQASR